MATRIMTMTQNDELEPGTVHLASDLHLITVKFIKKIEGRDVSLYEAEGKLRPILIIGKKKDGFDEFLVLRLTSTPPHKGDGRKRIYIPETSDDKNKSYLILDKPPPVYPSNIIWDRYEKKKIGNELFSCILELMSSDGLGYDCAKKT